MISSRTLPLILLALALGCAGPRAGLRAEQRQRVTDSPAEKMSAMPVPDPAADPENNNERFGVDSARERGETAQRKREEKRRCVDVVTNGEAAKGQKPTCPPANK